MRVKVRRQIYLVSCLKPMHSRNHEWFRAHLTMQPALKYLARSPELQVSCKHSKYNPAEPKCCSLCTLHHTVPAAIALLTLPAILETVASQSFASGKVPNSAVRRHGIPQDSLPTGPTIGYFRPCHYFRPNVRSSSRPFDLKRQSWPLPLV